MALNGLETLTFNLSMIRPLNGATGYRFLPANFQLPAPFNSRLGSGTRQTDRPSNACHHPRKLYSCETQLLVTIQDLLFHRDKHVAIHMAMDFSKALDVVPHRRLLGKLSLYGINGPILRWIEAFLTDRVQGVVVEGFRSPEGKVLSGVPQVLYWDPFCFCFILMTSHQSLLHRLGYLLMIASYTAPSAVVQTVRPCKRTWILWSDGVVHGA